MPEIALLIGVLAWLFWGGAAVIIYSYAGYGVVLFLLCKIPGLARLLPKPKYVVPEVFSVPQGQPFYPKVSFIISASGERKEVLREKIENTLALRYPREQLEVIFAIAYDQSGAADETLDEFYHTFLEDPATGVSSAAEELYIRFLPVEHGTDPRSPAALDELSRMLTELQFSSEDITPGAKELLDRKAAGADERAPFRILVTKDIRRKGKISQVNRTVQAASGEILVFTDANSMLNTNALENIIRHFNSSQVGCVAGEKRVKKGENSTSGEGEGLYWKYESFLKRLDSQLWTTVGAAGELFAIRKELWSSGIESNALIEDFVLSMRVAQAGYRVVYEPEAWAEEEPTFDLQSEYIRRRRIAAGGFQAIAWLQPLLNPFRYRVLTFQYVSHRVLRWAVVPFLLPIVFFINVVLFYLTAQVIYGLTLACQAALYLLAFTGWRLELRRKKIKLFYFPFVLMMMNWAAYAGLHRYLTGKQQVTWEKVRR